VKALLDTHILVWWLEGKKRLSRAQRRIIERASAERALGVSDISLWEIATLLDLGRLKLKIPLREWLEAAVAPPLVQRVGISPAVAADLLAFPTTFTRDPADRILVATARVYAVPLLTADENILESGLVKTVG
jgi:PIN domain nuclease of toxin-antitoxin system